MQPQMAQMQRRGKVSTHGCGDVSLSVAAVVAVAGNRSSGAEELGGVSLKINGWNIIPWRFSSDPFPVFLSVICRFQPLIFQGVSKNP